MASPHGFRPSSRGWGGEWRRYARTAALRRVVSGYLLAESSRSRSNHASSRAISGGATIVPAGSSQ